MSGTINDHFKVSKILKKCGECALKFMKGELNKM